MGDRILSRGSCLTCGNPLTKRWQRRCCSKSCAAKRTPIRPQDGANNGNFKNWRSKSRVHYVREFYARNPEKLHAQQLVAGALRRGQMVRARTCSACGVPCKADAHHPDYTRPLEVVWLCKKCHCAANAPRRDRVAARG